MGMSREGDRRDARRIRYAGAISVDGIEWNGMEFPAWRDVRFRARARKERTRVILEEERRAIGSSDAPDSSAASSSFSVVVFGASPSLSFSPAPPPQSSTLRIITDPRAPSVVTSALARGSDANVFTIAVSNSRFSSPSPLAAAACAFGYSVGGEMRRVVKSLRNGVHNANAVVWGPV